MFREALKAGWYNLLLARDAYRVAAGEHGLHRDLVSRFLEVRPSAGVSRGMRTCSQALALVTVG